MELPPLHDARWDELVAAVLAEGDDTDGPDEQRWDDREESRVATGHARAEEPSGRRSSASS